MVIMPVLTDIDWRDEWPADLAEPAAVLVTAHVGEPEVEGTTLFQVLVCNPAWIQARVAAEGGMWPRAHLLLSHVTEDRARRSLAALVSQFAGSADWPSFCERMNRYAQWELEDLDDFQGHPVPAP